MNPISVLLLLSCVVALSYACCTPDQWEGGEGSIGGYAGRRKRGLIFENARVAYDFTNKRSACFLSYHNGRYENKFQMVTKYDDDDKEGGKLYVVDLKKGKCWKKSLEKPFRQACVPKDAKSFGDYYMGLEGDFKVTGYLIKGKKISASVTVKNLDSKGTQCVPIGESVWGSLGRNDFVQSVGFLNISPGIKNETVFDVPKQCEEKEEFTLAEELTRDHYIMAL